MRLPLAQVIGTHERPIVTVLLVHELTMGVAVDRERNADCSTVSRSESVPTTLPVACAAPRGKKGRIGMERTNDRTLTAFEAAERLSLSVRTLDRLATAGGGGLRKIQLSDRRIGYLESDIETFISRKWAS